MAILRALGVQRRAILALFLMQLISLSLIACFIGIALAYGFQLMLTPYLTQWLPLDKTLLYWQPSFYALVTTLLLLAACCLPALLKLNRQNTQALLKRTHKAETIQPLHLLIAWGTFTLLAYTLTADIRLTQQLGTILILSLSLIYLASRTLLYLLKPLQHSRTVALRLTWLTLHRHPLSTFLQIIAFTLSLTTLFLLLMLQHSLVTQLTQEVNQGSPNVFILNLEPHQANAFIQQLNKLNWMRCCYYCYFSSSFSSFFGKF